MINVKKKATAGMKAEISIRRRRNKAETTKKMVIKIRKTIRKKRRTRLRKKPNLNKVYQLQRNLK